MSKSHEALSTMVAMAHFDSIMTSGKIGPVISNNFDATAALRLSVLNEDWKEAGRMSYQCLGVGYASFKLLQSEAISGTQRQRSAEASSKAFSTLLCDQVKKDHRAMFFGNLREKLSQRMPVNDTSWRESLHMLENGQSSDVPLLNGLSHFTLPSAAPGRKAAEDATITGLSRGLLGLLHAEFNLAFQTQKTEAKSLLNANFTEGLRATNEQFEELLRSGQQHIFDSLISNHSVNDAIQFASSLAGLIEHRMPGFARAQAYAALATRILRGQGKYDAAAELGREALKASALTREAVASHAASYLLAMDLLEREYRKEVIPISDRGSASQFDVPLPEGHKISLHLLDQVEEGEFIEVEGFAITQKVIFSSDGKPHSRMEIIDPSSGAKAFIVAVNTQFPNLGVTKGAFCRASGIYRRMSKLYDQKPAIEINDLPLESLANESWRIAFLISVDRWFRCWSSSGTNIYWSLGPQRRPQNDTELGYFGAGEIIYRPLIRK
jgi:hypothetical protein